MSYTYTPLEQQACSNCRYSRPHQCDDLTTCHANPPQLGPRGGKWPPVSPDDWCGNWVCREGRP
jgi:hypothetical protein